MSLSLLNSFSKDIEVIIDDENKQWFKRAHVGKYLEIKHIDTSVEGIDKREMLARNQFEPPPRNTGGDFKGQDHDIFLSVYGDQHCFVKSFFTKIC